MKYGFQFSMQLLCVGLRVAVYSSKKQIIIKGCCLPPKSIGNEWVVVAVSLTHAWCKHYQKPNNLTIASPQGINYWYHKRYQGSSNVENKNQISKHLTLIFHRDQSELILRTCSTIQMPKQAKKCKVHAPTQITIRMHFL